MKSVRSTFQHYLKSGVFILETCGLPFTVEENRGTFETERDHSIRAYHVYGKTVKARLYEDDTQDRYFHLYFNPSKHAAERERLSDTDVKSIAVEIGNQLSGEQTPTDKAPEEDDDYGEDTFTIID